MFIKGIGWAPPTGCSRRSRHATTRRDERREEPALEGKVRGQRVRTAGERVPAGQCLWEEAGCRRCWRVQRGGARATGFGSKAAMGDPGREGASWGVYGQCCF